MGNISVGVANTVSVNIHNLWKSSAYPPIQEFEKGELALIVNIYRNCISFVYEYTEQVNTKDFTVETCVRKKAY